MSESEIKLKYNKLLHRYKKGLQYLEESYTAKAHELLISIGAEMDAVLDVMKVKKIKVSQKEYEQGFKI